MLCIFFLGKDDKVIELLIEIEQEAKGLRWAGRKVESDRRVVTKGQGNNNGV